MEITQRLHATFLYSHKNMQERIESIPIVGGRKGGKW